MNYLQSLNEIENSSILSKDESTQLSELSNNLEHRFNVGQRFRSRYEMENSVLIDVKYPTPDSKYWQSVREQMVFFENLVILSYDYKKNLANLEILKCDKEEIENEIKLKQGLTRKPNQPKSALDLTIRKLKAHLSIKEAEIGQSEFTLICQQKVAQNRLREVLSWEDIMNKIIPEMKHGIDSYEEHQLESSYQRFYQEANLIQHAQGAGPADVRNILGQLGMADKRLKEQGIIPSTEGFNGIDNTAIDNKSITSQIE